MAFLPYFYDNAKLPKNPTILREINDAAKRLHEKLKAYDLKNADISPYNKEYLGGMMEYMMESLPIYTLILAWSLAKSKKKKEDFIFMDYGAGSGILCLLAKEYGVGTVIYTDIFDVSLNDAQVIAEALGLKAEHYVLGDVPETLKFLAAHNLSCDAIGTHDVIEHIYNVEEYFDEIPKFSTGDFSIVMLTIANPYNPWLVGRLKKIQQRLELTDREPEWYHKSRDSLKSYLSIRREMVENHLNAKNAEASADIVQKLAENTRGMIQADIEKTVDQYLESGKLPPAPKHPTNTCDPLTGNRAENLISPFILTDILKKHGFKTEVRGGYFWRSNSSVKRFIGNTLNWMIARMGWHGLRLATSMLVYAHKESK